MTNSLPRPLAIVLTGGGTAGHVWPHFALFEGDNPLNKAHEKHLLTVHYVGSHTGMEKDIVTSTRPQWHYHSISTGKLRRYFNLQNFLDPFKILLGIFQAFVLMCKEKPAVVFSKGGFVSAPVVWAAWLRGVPVVIHESDATPALATKLTLPFCHTALLAFKETVDKINPKYQDKTKEIGLPVRESLFSASREEGLRYFNFTSEKKTILIFGGSLGAQSLNEKVFALMPELFKKYQVIHIVGKGNKRALNLDNYQQFEFLTQDMKYAYAAADLAICRAGASSIFELAAARIPMILVPLGLHASRGDQIINARLFSKKGWAQWVDENSFQNELVLKLIDTTIDSLEIHKAALAQAPGVDAAHKVSELLWSIMTNNHRK